MLEGGLERAAPEPVEYWDSRCFEACDIGLGSVLRREGGEVMRGGSAVWLEPGDDTGCGDVAGDEVEDMVVAILNSGRFLMLGIETEPKSKAKHLRIPQRKVRADNVRLKNV